MQFNEVCESLGYFREMMGQFLYVYDRYGEIAQVGKPRQVCLDAAATVIKIVSSEEFTNMVQSSGILVNHISYIEGLVGRIIKNYKEVTPNSPSSLAMIKLANIHTQLGFLINCMVYPGWC